MSSFTRFDGSEKKFKKQYTIMGRTTAQKFVCVGYWSEMRGAVLHFIEKYPRFKGQAVIQNQMCEDLGNGLVCAEPGRWETVDSFQSTKELKQYVGG